jgi:hypothetical protein
MARDEPDDYDDYDDVPAPSSRWERFTAGISTFMLKDPPAAGSGSAKKVSGGDGPTTIPEIEAAIKRADDKERLIGLLAAPVAAAIGLLVTATLLAHDPKGIKHVKPSLYLELCAVTMVLALLILVMAWLRKRAFLGIAMALFGLSIFNLHYWGFGLPFIIGGAWYLVRSYRLSEKLKLTKAGIGPATTKGGGTAPTQASKRYTPPATSTRRTAKPKRGKELEAG